MSEKKGLFGGLFGKKQSGGCCNMEIIEETECDCTDDKISKTENTTNAENESNRKKLK